MAFWGVELKPGKLYCHTSSKTAGRLRLTQATFGFGNSDKRSFVQCNVGKKSPVLLCCLLPGKSECCHLDLEFDEVDNVVFSVIGPRSVHLTGYYLSSNSKHPGFVDSSESYGEDIQYSDNEKSNCSDEDDYEDSFIDDELEEKEIMTKKKSGERKASQHRRRLRKCQIRDSEDEGSTNLKSVSNEDDDKIRVSSLSGSGGKSDGKNDRNADKSDGKNDRNADKSDGDHDVADADIKRDPDIPHASSALKDLRQNRDELKSGKKKSKKRQKNESSTPPESFPANDKKPDNVHAPETNERTSKRKKRKITDHSEKQGMPSEDGIEIENPSSSGLIKTFSNGLIVEEVESGKPDGEVASLGRKVKIHFTGTLKEGGHVYDTSIGSKPFKFRLGKEDAAIKGLELGLEGMRVGGRRLLTVPPELGYGSQGVAGAVPPNSWLKLDIELLSVR